MYEPTMWVDDKSPDVNEDNLNKIEQGIKAAHDMAEHNAANIAAMAGNQMPEEYLKAAVDEYVNNNSAGFATQAGMAELESQLSDQIEANASQLSSEIVEFEGRMSAVDGVVYPAFERGSIADGSNNDEAYFLKKYARTIDCDIWKESLLCTIADGLTAYFVFYDDNKSYIGTSSGIAKEYDFANKVVAITSGYYRVIFRNTDSSDLVDIANKIKIEDRINVPNRVTICESNIEKIEEKIEDSNSYDVANGISNTGITSISENKIQKREYRNRNIIAINHDDLAPQDYLNTRKIYNKYGFNANFNFILRPFADRATMEEMSENVKALVADGNDLGLHAILGKSYWWMNKMFDIRPNSGFTFAPTLAELKTDVGNGKNVFGYSITDTSKFTDIGFSNIPADYANIAVREISENDYVTLLSYYSLYYSPEKYTGLDLANNVQTYKGLYWLEYWYNSLIDDTLGVSTSLENDYEIPSGADINDYYPDADHLINGKIVFFDDTDNVNYNNAEYQKVGRFKNGLFKGCASLCNYEVEDRCIEIAKAFCKYYFGVGKFTNFGRHGVGFVSCNWLDGNTPYDDRTKTVIAGEVGKIYNSRLQKFESQYDILLRNGIKMTNHCTPLEPIYESQIGLYYGQDKVRSPFFNHTSRHNGAIGFLNLLDTSTTYSGKAMPYDTVMKIIEDKEDLLKFAYENAGKQVSSTDGSVSAYVTIYVKMILDIIRACKDTGKIPVFSLDTIVNDASNNYAIEEICKYCYENDIDIVPMEYARKMACGNDREYKNNYFPNPSFTQSLINRFGECSEIEAYIPDGWTPNKGRYFGSIPSFDVVEEDGKRAFVIGAKGAGYNYLETRMYGLPSGTYNLKFKAKTDAVGSAYIQVFKKKNADLIADTNYIEQVKPTNEYVEYSIPITIDEPYRKILNDSVESQYSQGYEDNVSNIMLIAGLSTPNASADSIATLSLCDVKMELS